jgi:hypothetical protein
MSPKGDPVDHMTHLSHSMIIMEYCLSWVSHWLALDHTSRYFPATAYVWRHEPVRQTELPPTFALPRIIISLYINM